MATSAPQYDDVARDYERLIAPRYARVAEAIADTIDVRPDDSVLDIGAGTGGLSRLIVRRLGPAGRLALLDVSPGMLDVARRVLAANGPTVAELDFVVGDLAALPFGPASFQHVVAQFTPLQDSERGLAEAARVLEPGGRLTVGYWGPAYRELDLLNAVRARAGIEPAVPPDGSTVAGRVAAAGFANVRLEELRFPASYPDADSYLAYRAAFGRAVTVDEETWIRYWGALEDEVGRMAASAGSVELDWSVILLTADRA